MDQNVLILFDRIDPDGMHLFCTLCHSFVETLKFFLNRRTDQFGNFYDSQYQFALCDGRGKDQFPNLEGCKGFAVFIHEAMQEGGAAARITDDEDRLFYLLLMIAWKEYLIQQ